MLDNIDTVKYKVRFWGEQEGDFPQAVKASTLKNVKASLNGAYGLDLEGVVKRLNNAMAFLYGEGTYIKTDVSVTAGGEALFIEANPEGFEAWYMVELKPIAHTLDAEATRLSQMLGD